MPDCPKPWKVRYTESGAAIQLRHFRRTNTQNRKVANRMCVYRCECGSWHLGHNKYTILLRGGKTMTRKSDKEHDTTHSKKRDADNKPKDAKEKPLSADELRKEHQRIESEAGGAK